MKSYGPIGGEEIFLIYDGSHYNIGARGMKRKFPQGSATTDFIQLGGALRAAGAFTDHDEVGYICNECGMEMPGSAECNIHLQHTGH